MNEPDTGVLDAPNSTASSIFSDIASLPAPGDTTPAPATPTASVPDIVDQLTQQTLGEPSNLNPAAPPQTPAAPQVPPAQQQPAPPTVPPAPAPSASSPVAQTPQVDLAQWQAFQQWQQAQASQQPGAQVVVPPSNQQQPPPATPQAQPTPEEVNRMLNVYQLTEADYNAVFDTDDRAQSINALNQILQNVVKQAVTMSVHVTKSEVGGLVQQVSPYMQFADSQRELAMKNAFFESAPDLKGMDVVIEFAMNQLIQEKNAGKVAFKNDQEIFAAIAERTRAIRQQMSNQPAPTQPTPTAPTSGAPVAQPHGRPTMAVMPRGGQSGAQGAPQGAVGQNNTAVTIFG